MASNQTSNYGFSQWERGDKVQMEDFNADNAKIDMAIKAVDVRVDGKADTTAVDSLRITVNGKASQTALDSLAKTVAQHTTEMAGKGNCILYATSFTGSGKYGADNPSSLTFPHRPMVVFIAAGISRLTLVRGANSWCDQLGGGSATVAVTWGERSVQWYSINLGAQMSNGTSNVVALLDAEH